LNIKTKERIVRGYIIFILLWVPLMFWFDDSSLPAQIIEGSSLGFFIITLLITVFALTSPLFIDLLVNNPEGKPMKKIRFLTCFTYIEDGQAKIIRSGQKFVGVVMCDLQRVFEKTGDPLRNPEYWSTRSAKRNEAANPLGEVDSFNPISIWAHYVYKKCGAVLIGLYPFREVRFIKVKRTRPSVRGGKEIHNETTGTPVMEDVEDWSDHLRVKRMQWYFTVPSCLTLDQLKIGFIGCVDARCVNPYQSVYGIDRWDKALTNKIESLVKEFCATRKYEDIISGKGIVLSAFLIGELNNSLLHGKKKELEKKEDKKGPEESDEKDEVGIGIETLDVNIMYQLPQLSPSERVSSTAKWTAEKSAEADKAAAIVERKKKIIEATASREAKVIEAEGSKKARIKEAEASREAKILEAEGRKQATMKDAEADEYAFERRAIGEAKGLKINIEALEQNPELGLALKEQETRREAAQSGGATYFYEGKGAGGSDPATFAKLDQISKQLAKRDEEPTLKPEEGEQEVKIHRTGRQPKPEKDEGVKVRRTGRQPKTERGN